MRQTPLHQITGTELDVELPKSQHDILCNRPGETKAAISTTIPATAICKMERDVTGKRWRGRWGYEGSRWGEDESSVSRRESLEVEGERFEMTGPAKRSQSPRKRNLRCVKETGWVYKIWTKVLVKIKQSKTQKGYSENPSHELLDRSNAWAGQPVGIINIRDSRPYPIHRELLAPLGTRASEGMIRGTRCCDWSGFHSRTLRLAIWACVDMMHLPTAWDARLLALF